MRKAFTLIELMISIMLLSLIMLFLYKSYAELNRSNSIYAIKVQEMKKSELLKKRLYLDISVALRDSIKIINQSRSEDVLFLQTSSSVHKRINPYVAYFIKQSRLYRLESLKPFIEYPLASDSEFVSDYVADVKSMRIYPATNATIGLFLVHIILEDNEEILLKIKALNS